MKMLEIALLLLLGFILLREEKKNINKKCSFVYLSIFSCFSNILGVFYHCGYKCKQSITISIEFIGS